MGGIFKYKQNKTFLFILILIKFDFNYFHYQNILLMCRLVVFSWFNFRWLLDTGEHKEYKQLAHTVKTITNRHTVSSCWKTSESLKQVHLSNDVYHVQASFSE